MSLTPTPIKEFALGIYDGPHATPKKSDSGHIFLGIKNVTPDGRLDLSDIKFVSKEEFPKWTKRVTPTQGDVVFSYEATLHRYALIPEGFDGCLGRRMALVRPNPEKILSRYLHFYFLSPKWKGYVDTKVIVGATVNRLPIKDFPDFEISVPNIEEQSRVVDVLSAYDDLIENNRRRIALLEKSARLLYREWFVELRFPGYEHTRIIDGVPEGWQERVLNDIAVIIMGQSPKSEFYNNTGDGLPFHQGVTNYGERFLEHKMYCIKTTRIAEPKDIICSVRAPVGRLNITLDKIILGRGVSAIRSKTKNQSFLFYQLKNFFFKEDILGSGAIYASVTKKDMENITLLIPPEKLRIDFEDISKSIDDQVINLTRQNIQLKKARDILLPRLMNGEISV